MVEPAPQFVQRKLDHGADGVIRVVPSSPTASNSPAAPTGNPAAGRHLDSRRAPTQAARWAVQAVAKAGTIGTVGVYPPQVEHYPFGEAVMKNLTLKAGNCNHRRYVPGLVSMVATGQLDPTPLVSQWAATQDAVDAYEAFDRRESGWTKVALGLGGPGAMPPGSGKDASTGTVG